MSRLIAQYLLLCLLLSTGAWAKLPEPPASPALCKALLSAMRTGSDIFPEIHLPYVIDLQYGPTDFEQFYALNLGLWIPGNYIDRLKDHLLAVRDGRPLSAEELASYKEIRARLKQVRIAFVAFGKTHKSPQNSKKVASQMGHVKDSLANNRPDFARAQAIELLETLSTDMAERIQAELLAFEFSSAQSFRTYLREELDFLEDGLKKLERNAITADHFHEMRKTISRTTAVFLTIQTVRPSANTEMVVKYLTTLNGLMGNEHDRLIADALEQTLDYENAPISVDIPKLVPRLQHLIGRFRISIAIAEMRD